MNELYLAFSAIFEYKINNTKYKEQRGKEEGGKNRNRCSLCTPLHVMQAKQPAFHFLVTSFFAVVAIDSSRHENEKKKDVELYCDEQVIRFARRKIQQSYRDRVCWFRDCY